MAKTNKIIRYFSFALIAAAVIAAIAFGAVSCNYVRTTKYVQADNTDYYSQTTNFETEGEYREYIAQRAEGNDTVNVLPEGCTFIAAASTTVWIHEEISVSGSSSVSNLLAEEEIASYGDNVFTLTIDLALCRDEETGMYHTAANAYWQAPDRDAYAGQYTYDYLAVTFGGREQLIVAGTHESGTYADGDKADCAQSLADTTARVCFIEECEPIHKNDNAYLNNVGVSYDIRHINGHEPTGKRTQIKFIYTHTYGKEQAYYSVNYSDNDSMPEVDMVMSETYWQIEIAIDGMEY